MRRALFVLTLLIAKARADAAYWPVFTPTTFVQLRPGETITLNVYASWLSGISVYPFSPMTFAADDPVVANVSGYLPASWPAVPVRITALQPGMTRVRIVETGIVFATSPVIVVADNELPLAIEVNGVLAAGNTVTLKAISDAPDATFTWYAGELGGQITYTWEVAQGREFSFAVDTASEHSYWVFMRSPHGASARSVTLKVRQPLTRRRAANH
ncbi:MAG: hypothetical protein ACTHQM_00500 [Thermoanaerobaculia bacterium]